MFFCDTCDTCTNIGAEVVFVLILDARRVVSYITCEQGISFYFCMASWITVKNVCFLQSILFSSPKHKVLKVSYCDRYLSILHQSTVSSNDLSS